MKQKVLNLDNKVVKEIEISDLIFNTKVYPDIIHEYIRYQMAKSRQGSHKTKTRSEVKGKSKKPFAQKGTGGARQGSSKAPHFRGGAVSMGPQNRDHSYKLNKKQKKLALRLALSSKVKSDQIVIIENIKTDSNKTKVLNEKLNKFNFKSAIFIFDSEKIDDNFKLASSNLPFVSTLNVNGINVKDLIKHEKIFLSEKSINQLQEKLQ